jgi:hypothetical protein
MSDLSPQSDPKRTLLGRSHLSQFYEYTPFCNGPGDVKSP